MRTLITNEMRVEIVEWHNALKNKRGSLQKFLNKLNIRRTTYDKVMREHLEIAAYIPPRPSDEVMGELDDKVHAKQVLEEKMRTFDEVIYEAATVGKKSEMAKLWAKMHDLVIDKTVGVIIELSGAEIARRNLEAERQLRAEGYRVEKVPKELPVLHDKLLLDSGQDTEGDSEVATLEPLD